MTKERKVTNFYPYHAEFKLNGDFTITIKFIGRRGHKIEGSNHEINIHLELYWLRFFNTKFCELADKARRRIDDTGF